MKRYSLSCLAGLLCFCQAYSQKVTGKLVMTQGQTFSITTSIKNKVSQEAMGNAIDFDVEGSCIHQFAVTNATNDNTTLHHKITQVTFRFDGMGQNRSFNSDNPRDLDGFFGAPVKDMLSKSYDIIIDTAGKVLLAKPDKVELAKADDRLTMVFNMLNGITDVVYPPKKNSGSFFKVLPDTAVGLHDSWTEASATENGKVNTMYTVNAITDSTVTVDIRGKSSSAIKSEMMGMPTTTTMTNNFTGSIVVDRVTGIIREKTVVTESSGSTEAMGGTMPVTSKITVTTSVRAVPAAK